MANWYLGTMGFGYKDWSGVFYPVTASSQDYLSYYSRSFNAVELDTTFYGSPRPSIARSWADSTPPGFRFCAKTPRSITHERGLVGAADLMFEFLSALQPLGEKLGVVLLQFPPSFDAQQSKILASFLGEIRADRRAKTVRLAVEFRHASWYTDRQKIASILGDHDVCWASTEYPDLPGELNRTTAFLYIRWIGQHGTYRTHERERVDQTRQLESWWQRLKDAAGQVENIYGFFNNDYAGHAPATCNRFKAIAGLPVHVPYLPKQGRLF
jgi:uncharacterized protein YecE (DUF72 family)